MLLHPCEESHRLEALIQDSVGRQVDELHVLRGEDGLILQGRAFTTLAFVLAQVEAARLSGLPVVENRIQVN
jgi:hypothetical protein